MKIIRHGKYIEGRIICKTCGCEFNYDKDDVIKKERDVCSIFYRPKTLLVAYVYCPECKTKRIINMEEKYK